MPKKEPKTTPFTLRLTPQERALLERLAGKIPVGEFIRSKVFGSAYMRNFAPAKRQQKTPQIDHTLLSKILAKLGASQFGPNLKTLADAARFGALPVTPETELAIQKACHSIAWIKSTLMAALGIKES